MRGDRNSSPETGSKIGFSYAFAGHRPELTVRVNRAIRFFSPPAASVGLSCLSCLMAVRIAEIGVSLGTKASAWYFLAPFRYASSFNPERAIIRLSGILA